MKAKQLLILLLTGTLSLALVGCNESLEDTPTENPAEPGNGDDGGGDDGNGGDDGSGDGDDSGEPVENVGTWENKDEDGDGVPDELDDYPFDPTKTTITVVQEQEFNNNVAEANPVGTVPFKAAGVISQELDIDDFKFSIPSSMLNDDLSVTFILFKDEDRFTPSLTIIDNNGDVISSIPTNIQHVGKIGQAITFSPKRAGEFNLSVTDRNNLGAESFSYLVHAFVDTDKDAVPDNKEQALGMNYRSQDTDGDGITDGNEYHIYSSGFTFNHDVDGDGTPNWLDLDSDGDGIPDEIELTYDLDNDKQPAFVDLDSDGNSVLDSEEINLVEFIRYDLDGDGIPNFLDTDDDGDFLFDKYDPNPLEKLTSINNLYPTNMPQLNSTSYVHSDDAVFINSVRPFFPANLNAENLKGNDVYLVILKGDDKQPVVNLPVTITSDNRIEFVIPNYPNVALGGEPISFFLAIDGYKTNSIDATLLHPKTPIITDIPTINAVEGDKVLIIGENLSLGTSIVFVDGPTIKLDYIDDTSASFIVPKDIGTGSFSLKNVFGESNYSSISMKNQIEVSVDIPSYLNKEGKFFLSGLDKDFNNLDDIVNQSFTVDNNTKYITLFWNNIRFLQAFRSGSSEITLTVESTINSLVLNSYSLNNKVDNYEVLLETMLQLPSYIEFKQWYISGLQGNNLRGFLEDASYEIVTKAALVADDLSKLQNENVNKRSSSKLKASSRFNTAQFSLESTSNNGLSSTNDEQRPTIAPDSSQDGLRLEPTQKGIFDLFDYDGFTELQNSSPMYLSAAAYKINNDLVVSDQPEVGLDPSDKDNKKAKTYSHITSFIDRDMVAPTNYRVFAISLWSKDSYIKACQYQNCLIEVITPGIRNNPSKDIEKVKVSKYLFMKNLVDAIILPTFSYVTELAAKKKNLKDPIDPKGYIIGEKDRGTTGKMLITLLWKEMTGIADAIDDAYQDGEVTVEERQDIIQEVKKMLENEKNSILQLKPGPVLSAIVKYYGYGLSDFVNDLKAKVAFEIAEAFVPGIGQALKVYDGLALASGGANLAENWYDFQNMDMIYEFRINWGLKILKLTPGILSKDDYMPALKITGIGLCPQRSAFNSPIYPKIYYKDITTGINKEVIIKNLGSLDDSYMPNEACNEVTVYIPPEIIGQATLDSKIEVEVVFDDNIANSAQQNSSPRYLTFADGVKIDSVNPNPAFTEQLITITGVGFDTTDLTNNEVFFTSANGELLKGDILSSDSSLITVKVPAGAVTGTVTVRVGDDQDSSPIEISESEITFTFGDNGNVIDDSFQVSLDGEIIDETTPGQRKKTNTVTTELGEHDIIIKGITVPDQRATYYICFSNNVDIISGEQDGKVDFPVGTQFSQNLKIKVNNTPTSNPVGCKFFDNSVAGVKSSLTID